jgi:hypothetical protein
MEKRSVLTILIFCLSIVSGISQDETIVTSPYLFPEFSGGKIRFKNGTEKESKLNYNILTEEMVFDNNGTNLAFANPELIDTVYIKGKIFVYGEKMFYELIEKLPVSLLQRHFCTLIPPGKNAGYGGTSQTSAIQANASFYTSKGTYDLKLPDDYKIQPDFEYIFLKDGTIYRANNLSQVSKCFPEKKDAIKEFVKKNKTNFRKVADMRNLIQFCNK